MIIEPYHVNKDTDFKEMLSWMLETTGELFKAIGVGRVSTSRNTFCKSYVSSAKAIVNSSMMTDSFSTYLVPCEGGLQVLTRFEEVVVEQNLDKELINQAVDALKFNKKLNKEARVEFPRHSEERDMYIRRREECVPSIFKTRFIYTSGAEVCPKGAQPFDALRALRSIELNNMYNKVEA